QEQEPQAQAQAQVSEQTESEESKFDRLKRYDSLSRELYKNSGVLHEIELDQAAHKHLERAMSGEVNWHTAPDNETDEGQAAAISHEGQSNVTYHRNYLSELDSTIEGLEKQKIEFPVKLSISDSRSAQTLNTIMSSTFIPLTSKNYGSSTQAMHRRTVTFTCRFNANVFVCK
ncbi:MAG: hypothetical protein HLX50_17115, partial [Alteromonadaceae bacterium]|nr:hypothetical protein [Alteromonadaceae bacterium]